MIKPPIGRMKRRTTRKSETDELMEDLWIGSLTSEKLVRRALKKPTDIGVEIELNEVADGEELTWEQTEMVPKEASLYRAVTTRLNFLAMDRADLQFASNECSRRMSCPRNGNWAALKRVGRFLIGCPRMITTFVWQDQPACL